VDVLQKVDRDDLLGEVVGKRQLGGAGDRFKMAATPVSVNVQISGQREGAAAKLDLAASNRGSVIKPNPGAQRPRRPVERSRPGSPVRVVAAAQRNRDLADRSNASLLRPFPQRRLGQVQRGRWHAAKEYALVAGRGVRGRYRSKLRLN
jgi:hypothetical protein